MDPRVIESFIPIVFFLVCAIPLFGLTVRFAAKPIIEALVRYKELQAQTTFSEQTLQLQERRISLLETELQHVQSSMERLAEAEHFRAQLEAPRS
jgi:hypothetical protein